ncbi:MAG: COG2426 family protein [Bacillota bacterium]
MEFILDIFAVLPKELMVIFVAALPVLELRFAIPIGVARGLDPFYAMTLGIMGSMIPVPFLLLFLKPVFREMRKTAFFRKFVDWVTHRTMKKTGKIRKYSVFGLAVFVAVPIPSTGVWTGAIAAALLDIRFIHAFTAILAGNCVAAVIVTFFSHMAVINF